MSAVICLSLLLLFSLVGGTRTTSSIKILEGEGGSCEDEEETCSLQSTVNKSEDKEIKIDVIDSGTYIKIHTTVGKQDLGNHGTIVFVLTTEVSVKTWRISSDSSGDSLEHTATLLPTNILHSNIKLVISTKSDGKCFNYDGGRFLENYFLVQQLYTVDFRALDREEVLLKQNRSLTTVISPTSQALFQYKYEDQNPDGKFVVKVFNTQQFPVCSMVSIQDLSNEEVNSQV